MKIPEYHPPPRTGWLALPEGVIVERDDPDWTPPPPIGSYVRYPRERPYKPFVDKFGHEAGIRWGLDWKTPLEVVKEVVTSERLEKQFYPSPLLEALGA